ncbi:MAG TPA: NAD(P)H-dependent oxidoreductase [Microscillaceae bacterium]|nr:NAD(P)H-dependent oxidoreductase [Microscillaceae bacterium]
MELINHLNWRYATKKFDPTQTVSQDNLDKIKKAIQLSASSYGLQLYKVLIITDYTLRKRLLKHSWDQNQIVDASHLLVFCNYVDVQPEQVKEYLQYMANTRNLPLKQLEGYGEFMINSINQKTNDEKNTWLKCQTYLALGNLLAACAELKIDACPMEGFNPDAYNSILNLQEKGLQASVIATIGYRHSTDNSQTLPKVRKPIQALFEEV